MGGGAQSHFPAPLAPPSTPQRPLALPSTPSMKECEARRDGITVPGAEANSNTYSSRLPTSLFASLPRKCRVNVASSRNNRFSSRAALKSRTTSSLSPQNNHINLFLSRTYMDPTPCIYIPIFFHPQVLATKRRLETSKSNTARTSHRDEHKIAHKSFR